jgi:hypothetical protein
MFQYLIFEEKLKKDVQLNTYFSVLHKVIWDVSTNIFYIS